MSAPPYMKLFWGDYHKATRHLNRSQHGAYFLLIGEAWRLGGSLPDDDSMLAAWALCTPAEWVEIKPTVLAFFALRRGRWVHDRVREELAHYESISRKRKEAGREGGKTRGGKRKGKSEAIATQKPPKSESESELELEPPFPPEESPVEYAFRLWNETAARCDLPKALSLTEARRKSINKRLDDAGLDGWRAALEAVEVSKFCRGLAPGRDFKADLDFVCQARSFQRLREGSYGRDVAPPSTPAKPTDALDPWRRRVRAFKAEKHWNRSEWDGPPGSPDCIVPAEVLLEFGYEPTGDQGELIQFRTAGKGAA